MGKPLEEKISLLILASESLPISPDTISSGPPDTGALKRAEEDISKIFL